MPDSEKASYDDVSIYDLTPERERELLEKQIEWNRAEPGTNSAQGGAFGSFSTSSFCFFWHRRSPATGPHSAVHP